MALLKLKRLTIAEVEKQNTSSLFVMNKSVPRGNINFTIADGAGQSVGIQVPQTWIPVDLSNFAVKEDVIRNPNFRRLVARGFFHLVDAAEAESVLQEPKAQKENDRIYGVIEDISEDEFSAPVDKQINAQVSDSNISPFIQNIILRSTQEPASDLIVELDGKADTLSIKDAQDLMGQVSNAEIKSWAAELIEMLNDNDED